MEFAVARKTRVRVITPALVCPALIGRQAEIEDLAERARAVARGRGGLVLVGGEAGIGKTRLMRELRERLSNGRGAFAVGSCSEFGQAPYGPFAELLEALGGDAGAFGHETLAQQFNAIAEEFNALTAHRSTVCVIEDLHWADEGTLQLLSFLAKRITRYRLLLIATYRSDELGRYHQALPYIGRIARETGVLRMQLEPLSETQLQDMLRTASAGRPRLARHVFDAIVERCEGNPFFAEELMKNAYERLQTDRAESLPIAIAAAVSERLRLLDPPERRMIEHAAVIAAPFTAELLARVDGADVADVLEALRAACDLQLLIEETGEPVRFRFRHALTRDAVYGGLLTAEVRPLHRRIAQALEESAPADVAAIGYHWWAARDAEKARTYNERAAEEAERVHSYADAVRLYERALEMTDDGATRAKLFGRIAMALLQGGDADRASRIYETARGLYREAGMVREAADLDLQVIAATHTAGEGERAMQLAHEAYEALPPDAEHGLRLRMLSALVFMYTSCGKMDQARSYLADAEALRERGEADEQAGGMYYNALAQFYAYDGDLERYRAAARGYLAFADAHASNMRLYSNSRVNVVASALTLGLDELAKTALDELFALFERTKPWGMTMHALIARAIYTFRRGELAEARAAIERAIALPVDLQLSRVTLAEIAMSVGGALADEDLISRVMRPDEIDLVMRTQSTLILAGFAAAYATWLAGRGQSGAAMSALEIALENRPHALTHSSAFVVAAQIGDERMRDRARELFDRCGDVSGVPALRAQRALFDAILAQRLGENAAAVAAANQARALYDGLGWKYYSAIADEAAGDHAAALAKYREMGAIRDIRRLELGVREEQAAPATPQRGALSERERQIAELVAGGASNKAIAQQLFVSQKTVEKHITAIYQKLGFSRRSELTAFIVRGA